MAIAQSVDHRYLGIRWSDDQWEDLIPMEWFQRRDSFYGRHVIWKSGKRPSFGLCHVSFKGKQAKFSYMPCKGQGAATGIMTIAGVDKLPDGHVKWTGEDGPDHDVSLKVYEGTEEFEPAVRSILETQRHSDGECERLSKMGARAHRPLQSQFSALVRELYDGRCAISGCTIPAALQAAHIRTHVGVDDNSPANGVLLRADLHALLDAGLLTFSRDGTRVEMRDDLRSDDAYRALEDAEVFRPPNRAPSSANILWHRRQSGFER